MQFLKLFPTPVVMVDASEIMKSAEKFFNKSILTRRSENSSSLKTSLVLWSGGSSYTKQEKDTDTSVIKKFIIQKVEDYLNYAGYDLSFTKLKVQNIWANEMVSGSEQTTHNHVGCVMSGCLYLEAPTVGGEIKFHNPSLRFDRVNLPIKEYTELNSEIWGLQPKQGQMFIWHSHLQHSVPESIFEGVRKSIAFDVVVESINI
jgi:uncharacterized protein (TIGR02466 family)